MGLQNVSPLPAIQGVFSVTEPAVFYRPRGSSVSECCRTEVSIQTSTIRHAEAGNGVYASPNFERKDLAGPYYRSLASRDLARELRSRKQYVENYEEVTAKSSWK